MKRWLCALAVLSAFCGVDAIANWAAAASAYENVMPFGCKGTWQRVPTTANDLMILHVFPFTDADGTQPAIIVEDYHHQRIGELAPGEEGAWKCNGDWEP